jgi:hypothetical protein
VSVDRSAVRRGDTITWRTGGGEEAAALVLYKTASAVTVLAAGIGLPVDWRQVCDHQPQQQQEEARPCPA